MIKQLSRIAVVLLLVASILILSSVKADAHEPSCGDHPNQNKGFAISRTRSLTGEQVGNARVIMGIAQERRLPRQAAEIAITASLQASSLRNSPGNNYGLFQQVPRYYPGVAISSPRSATNAFYDRLVTVRNWKTMPVATTARTVQGARATRAFTTNAPIAAAVTKAFWGDAANPTQCPIGTSSAPANGQVGTSSSTEDKATTTTRPSSAKKKTTTTKRPTTTKRTTTTKRATTTKKPAAKLSKIFTISGTNRVRVGGIEVNRTIGTNLQGLLAAAATDGITLSGSGWRDPARQVQLRKQNCGPTAYSIYRKPASLCQPPTAIPGRSNHEKGLAIDFRNCSTRSTTCYKWLKANASKYGLRNLPSEPWHWSTNGR